MYLREINCLKTFSFNRGGYRSEPIHGRSPPEGKFLTPKSYEIVRKFWNYKIQIFKYIYSI